MRGGCCAVLAAMIVLAVAAHADVYEWRDESGSRHFTNDAQGVPPAYRDSARVLIADWRRPAAETKPEPAVAPAPPAASAAPIVVDTEPWSEAYAAGMRAAIELGGAAGGGGGGVQINGPLAVAVNRSEQAEVGAGFYPPWPWYYPFVTTSFDRGRSRHQTLRMLLQDQFQIDRDGPYGYDRWDQPGLGPALAPFLSRGLPYGVRQYGRVIYR